jgi:glycosyltransferase involved in cell wall biosynthesis
MSNPYFTVVIPVYNRARLITGSIASVTHQTFADFEVLVVNDGSTDDTEEVVKTITDPRVRCISTVNRERGSARNTGTQQAKGAYITFLDSDDRLYPDHLAKVFKAVEKSNMEIYHQAYEVVKDDGRKIARMSAHDGALNELLFTRGNVMSCMGVFIRRDIALANLFDERRELAGVEDWELWIRLAAKYPIFHGAEVTAAVVQHAGRSVNLLDGDRWAERMSAFLAVVEGNQAVRDKYAGLFPLLRSNVNTYLGLHLSESPHEKRRAIRFLLRGLRHSPSSIFQRRTAAILRNVLFR